MNLANTSGNPIGFNFTRVFLKSKSNQTDMTLSERRNKLQSLLQDADENLLSKLELVIVNHLKSSRSSIDDLPSDVQELLARSIEDVRSGDVRLHENVLSDFREKYGTSKKE